ncbi:MAG: copper chaperone PCu(A)C [Gammaproteobacteria bacterium]|nr:copper chaperone PCu(A)C [Gammaproteobacteria bacterium]
MKSNTSRALGTLLLSLLAFSVAAEELMITNPWVRSAPPNAPALGVFMKLSNHSSDEIAVVEVRTSLEVSHAEMHRTVMTDGVMKMIPQKQIPVAAHSSTELKPGSWHIMLMQPEQVPVMGDSVHLTLVLSDGTEQMVVATVRKGEMKMDSHSHEMKMD